MKLEIVNSGGVCLAEFSGEQIDAVYQGEYQEGDALRLTGDGAHWVVRLDATLAESMIYVPARALEYTIPFGEKRNAYDPSAFCGDTHAIRLREATEEEIYSQRNLALNSAAKRGCEACYPYPAANFVTRNESVFEERNAIDGHKQTQGHGNFPFQSWGGGAREDLDFKLFFGRRVEVDYLVFYLRSDYADDHDTYWKELMVEFSDGTTVLAQFEKTPEGQRVSLPKPRTVEWLRLTGFRQAASPLTWAALTELEVYGRDSRKA